VVGYTVPPVAFARLPVALPGYIVGEGRGLGAPSLMPIDNWWFAEYRAQVISVMCSHHRVLKHAGTWRAAEARDLQKMLS
ncbi:hypothetical protein PspLS_09036, partial [Pyricularia sp. CBS 133598]